MSNLARNSTDSVSVILYKNILVSDAVVQILLQEGVDTIFGIPGGYLSPFLDSCARAGIRSIESRHESSAASMAAGYHQATGRIPVIYTQSGPGTTNCLTGVASAYLDSIPLVVICGQTLAADYARDGLQESTGANRSIDQLDIFATVSTFRARPPTPDSLIRTLRVAFAAARAKRGPAIIDIYADLLQKKIDFVDSPPETYGATPRFVDVAGATRLLSDLDQADRPLFLIGDQCCHIGINDALERVIEKMNIPFATVDYAKGILPENHPLCLGVVGQAGHQSVTDYMRESDLVVLFGVRMNNTTTLRYDATAFKNLIQVDTHGEEIGRCLPVSYGVISTMTGIFEFLDSARANGNSRTQIRKEVQTYRGRHKIYNSFIAPTPESRMKLEYVYKALRAYLPAETIVVGDVGLTTNQLKKHFPILCRNGFFSAYAFGAMGEGFPMALGVQAANPSHRVVSVIGDGGFLVHASELNVAAQNDLPVIVVVIKNGAYKSVADRQQSWLGRTFASTIKNGNYAKVAEGFDCLGFSCSNLEELRSAVAAALTVKRPSVIEVEVDRSESFTDALPENVKAMISAVMSDKSDGWPFPKK